MRHPMTPVQRTTQMSLNHFIAYALDLALGAILLAGFFGAMHAATAISLALVLYGIGFVRAALS